jgi:hypothetical protein
MLIGFTDVLEEDLAVRTHKRWLEQKV